MGGGGMTAKERLALEVDLEGAGPPEVPGLEVGPEDPSPFHAVSRWVAAMWPWARFAGITARMWPYLGGEVSQGGGGPWPLWGGLDRRP